MSFFIANAIRCWDCNSNTDINCADPFNNRSVSAIDCREKCRKITQIGEFSGLRHFFVVFQQTKSITSFLFFSILFFSSIKTWNNVQLTVTLNTAVVVMMIQLHCKTPNCIFATLMDVIRHVITFQCY